jgi:tetratricopeptide (TPR) repeat protein
MGEHSQPEQPRSSDIRRLKVNGRAAVLDKGDFLQMRCGVAARRMPGERSGARMKITAAFICLFALVGSAWASAPLPPDPLVAEIRTALRAGELDAAIRAAERAVKARADDAEAWWWAGRAYGQQAMRASVFAKAKWASRTRAAFERSVELDPGHLRARYDLMNYYLMAPGIMGGGRDKADAQAAAIAAVDPSMGKVAEARLAGADKQPERAERLLQDALQLDPVNLAATQSLAGIAVQRKDWATVRSLWQQKLEYEQHRSMAKYQLARAAALSGEQLEEGLVLLDRFIAAGEVPDELSMAAAYWRRGHLLEKLGRKQEAIESLQLAIDDPDIGSQAVADLERVRKL